MILRRINIFLAAAIASFALVLIVRAWVEPNAPHPASGGVEAPLVSKVDFQRKLGVLKVDNIIIRSYRDANISAYPGPEFQNRGEFLSKILNPDGLQNALVYINPLSWRRVSNAVGIAMCPADMQLLSCAGSREELLRDTCNEDRCGLVGIEPIDAREKSFAQGGSEPFVGCRTMIDDDNDTEPVAVAFCLRKVMR